MSNVFCVLAYTGDKHTNTTSASMKCGFRVTFYERVQVLMFGSNEPDKVVGEIYSV